MRYTLILPAKLCNDTRRVRKARRVLLLTVAIVKHKFFFDLQSFSLWSRFLLFQSTRVEIQQVWNIQSKKGPNKE